jgi:NDP-sugar pyrophosphorylase family protein
MGKATVVIMAGGRGERLRPLTDHDPKPMLRLGSKPMLECVIDRFVEQGFRDFILTVHYRADLIRRYFGDGAKWGVSIRYVEEDEPLGTAGALRLLPPMDGPFIVANADVIVDIDYAALLDHHASRDALATMCLAVYQHQVPYGVVDTEGPFVSGMREKPIEAWPVNAGVYVISPALLPHVPDGFVSMPDLLAGVPGFVAAYPVDGYWQDVGRFEDYARAGGTTA